MPVLVLRQVARNDLLAPVPEALHPTEALRNQGQKILMLQRADRTDRHRDLEPTMRGLARVHDDVRARVGPAASYITMVSEGVDTEVGYPTP